VITFETIPGLVQALCRRLFVYRDAPESVSEVVSDRIKLRSREGLAVIIVER